MAVMPGWQGTGVAAQLLRTAESHLQQSDRARVALDTTAPLRRAIAFTREAVFVHRERSPPFLACPSLNTSRRFKLLAGCAQLPSTSLLSREVRVGPFGGVSSMSRFLSLITIVAAALSVNGCNQR